MMTRLVAAVRAFVAGVGELFKVLYHTPHGC